MSEILARSEAMTRARIADFREGEYHARDCLDGDGMRDDPQWIDATVVVKDGAITVDLTGSSDQSTGGMNCSRASAISGVQYAIKSITDPENPPNAGSYRPITVLTRPGSFCDALPPRSIVGYGEVAYRVLDTVMRALADAAPQQVLASGSGSTGTVAIGGQDNRPEAKRGYFVALELSSGAYGARATKDGLNAIRYGAGNAGHVPVEASEMENPIRYDRIEILPDTGGPVRTAEATASAASSPCSWTARRSAFVPTVTNHGRKGSSAVCPAPAPAMSSIPGRRMNVC